MSEPIARDALAEELKGAQAKGAKVHVFDPSASPQQKAASAGKAQGQLTSVANGAGNLSSHGSAAKGVSCAAVRCALRVIIDVKASCFYLPHHF
jgi:hypothetical protein